MEKEFKDEFIPNEYVEDLIKMAKKKLIEPDGLKSYKAFLEAVASEGLGYAVTNYFSDEDFESITKYDKELADSLMDLRIKFTNVEDRVFTDAMKFGIEI